MREEGLTGGPRRRARTRGALVVVLCGSLLVAAVLAWASEPVSPLPSAAPTHSVSGPSNRPLRGAFYYSWFPENWMHGRRPNVEATPSSGLYRSADPRLIARHVAAMRYAHIDVGISSWWGQGTPTDRRLPALLRAAQRTDLRWSVYYEPEGRGNPSPARIRSDLTYLSHRYGSMPAFLHKGGGFVVFVYADPTDGCEMVRRWHKANVVAAHVVLKVFPSYQRCRPQPAGWHQYSPAKGSDRQRGFSYSISPGFKKVGEPPRLARTPEAWRQAVQTMVASGEPWQLVTTFNEWGEGTSVEGAREWSTRSGFGTYLDGLHAVPTTGAETTAPPAPASAAPAPATGTPGPASGTPGPVTPSPVLGPEPVLAAVGDVACDPSNGSFNDGHGTVAGCRHEAVAGLVDLEPAATAVALLGDVQYEAGAYDAFGRSFDPSWGKYRARIHPAAGNHEYNTPGASGYFQYFGAAAGSQSTGYYSYDLGNWHVIVVNSNCGEVGCATGSPQERWVRADVEAHPAACTLAYWHHPRFSSGEHGDATAMSDIWRALDDGGADVVLSGHDHDYERFAPQTATGVRDDARGVRQFVVGTGGRSHYGIVQTRPNSEAHDDGTYGLLKLTLHPTSYTWLFVPEAGATFTDSGSAVCH